MLCCDSKFIVKFYLQGKKNESSSFFAFFFFFFGSSNWVERVKVSTKSSVPTAESMGENLKEKRGNLWVACAQWKFPRDTLDDGHVSKSGCV